MSHLFLVSGKRGEDRVFNKKCFCQQFLWSAMKNFYEMIITVVFVFVNQYLWDDDDGKTLELSIHHYKVESIS